MNESRVLLAVYTAGHFTELVRVARLLRRSGRYTPLLWFAQSYQEIDRDVGLCEAEQIPHVKDRTGLWGGSEAGLPAPTVAPTAYSRAARLVRAALSALPFPFTAIRAIARQGQHVFLARQILARERPTLVIVAEDTVGYETAALIKAAHERGVPSVIVPFTVANALEPAEMFFDHPAHSLRRWSNRLVASLYPKWVYEYRGRRLLRMPGPQVVAKERWGLAPPLPWQMNSGAADALTVESPFMEAYYRREGLPPPKLVLTGAISDDTLAEHLRDAPARRAALCAELGLPPERRLILCALPDDRFSLRGSQTEFADYSALVRFVIQTLAATGSTVIVRLHPRSNYEAHRYIEQWGVTISQLDTATLVPLCDWYMASVSATIRWAVACGKPVLNYDVYRLRLTDYADAPGVIRVEDRGRFAAAVQQLTSDEAFFAKVRARQQADAARWGRLDGHAGVRILECLDTAIAERRKEAGA